MSLTEELFGDEPELSRIEKKIHHLANVLHRIDTKLTTIMSTQAEFNTQVEGLQTLLEAIAATIASAPATVPPIDTAALDPIIARVSEISTELTNLFTPPVPVPPAP